MGLAGESGSGKSTAGKTMLNLIKPSGGRVIFEGKQIFDADKGEYLDSGSMTALRQKMQIIFQDPSSSLNPQKKCGADYQCRHYKAQTLFRKPGEGTMY